MNPILNRRILVIAVIAGALVSASACGDESMLAAQTTYAVASPCSDTGVPLSPVGAAVFNTPGLSDNLSRCAAIPGRWIYDMATDAEAIPFYDLAETQLKLTRSSFSHASLYHHPSDYEFAAALVDLNTRVASRFAGPVPDGEKPIVRFYFGDTNLNAQQVYDELTAQLPVATAWNVKVAVTVSKPSDLPLLEPGWNHSKLVIRDRIEVAVTSFETLQHELSMHLGGEPAGKAQTWFDVMWIQQHAVCAPSGSPLCGVIPGVPSSNPALPYPDRAVNVFALERGDLDWGGPLDADMALISGMRGATKSIFFLNPGLVGFFSITRTIYSLTLVDEIAARLAAGIDVKFVWGDPDEHPLTFSIWESIDDRLEARFVELGLSEPHKDIAHCMFHLARYTGAPNARTHSHAKFYMLDRSFYIGSQNLYPSGFIRESIPLLELKEFGFLVDTSEVINRDLATEIITEVADPAWEYSRSSSMLSTYANCLNLPHEARIVGFADMPSGTLRCSNNLDLMLDFHGVRRDQIATATASGTCLNPGFAVQVHIEGEIRVGGVFEGTISGSLPGGAGGQTALRGSLHNGELLLSFSHLDLASGVVARGTVATRDSPCPGLQLADCAGDCAWYACAADGAGACFSRGTPDDTVCPPHAPETCATINSAGACVNGCSWYLCAADGAGACFPTGTPDDIACPPSDPATCAAIGSADACTNGCAWYACAADGAGGCFPRGTPNGVACFDGCYLHDGELAQCNADPRDCAYFSCNQTCWPEGTPEAIACRTYLGSGIPASSASVGWGTYSVDENWYGPGFNIDGTHYLRGFFAHSPSTVSFEVGGNHTVLDGCVGQDDDSGSCGNGSFASILGDGEPLWTRFVGNEMTECFTLDITGVQTLSFEADEIGNFFCDELEWVNVMVDPPPPALGLGAPTWR